MTKKQKITIASVAGACALVLAAAIICIVVFVGGGDSGGTEPASVSTVSSLEEIVPAQSETEGTSQMEQEPASAASTESQPDTQEEQPGQSGQETTTQQAIQTTPQATTPAATTSTPANPTTSAPAATAPTTPSTPSAPAEPTQPSPEDPVADFNARAPQIIQLAYQKLSEIGVTAYPNAVDPNTNCWTSSYADPNLVGQPAPWQDCASNLTWSDEKAATDLVEWIQYIMERDGREIVGVQIQYLGVNYGSYQDNDPTFRIYNW